MPGRNLITIIVLATASLAFTSYTHIGQLNRPPTDSTRKIKSMITVMLEVLEKNRRIKKIDSIDKRVDSYNEKGDWIASTSYSRTPGQKRLTHSSDTKVNILYNEQGLKMRSTSKSIDGKSITEYNNKGLKVLTVIYNNIWPPFVQNSDKL